MLEQGRKKERKKNWERKIGEKKKESREGIDRRMRKDREILRRKTN